MRRGCLISLEGIEGAGKSSHVEAICSLLNSRGIVATATREPGGTQLGEALRELLLSRKLPVSAQAELLMLFAARAEHISTVIRPALDKGHWVVSDRFTDASYAYQGGGRGCDRALLDALSKTVCAGVQADLTLLLDVSLEVATARIATRGKRDRFEAETGVFFEAVRRTYLEMAARDPARWRVIRADRSIDDVKNSVISRVSDFLDHRHTASILPAK